jgi:hypothetical protein
VLPCSIASQRYRFGRTRCHEELGRASCGLSLVRMVKLFDERKRLLKRGAFVELVNEVKRVPRARRVDRSLPECRGFKALPRH